MLQGAPEELWVSGQEGFCGRYVLLQEVHNDHPAYRRAKDGAPGGDFYLWFRGGNWGVTSTLSSSPLAAPFQARCPDISGRARHPLELRRPRPGAPRAWPPHPISWQPWLWGEEASFTGGG